MKKLLSNEWWGSMIYVVYNNMKMNKWKKIDNTSCSYVFPDDNFPQINVFF